MRLEWDPEKARRNLARRGISFREASTVMGDPLAGTRTDHRHDAHEPREITVGMSDRQRILVVYHVRRGDRLRIIGARLPTASERHDYEER